MLYKPSLLAVLTTALFVSLSFNSFAGEPPFRLVFEAEWLEC
jgi:hypothetical protein